MKRNGLLVLLLALVVTALAASGTMRNSGETTAAPANTADTQAGQDFEPLEKSESEWRELLDADAYRVLFEEGTERPFTSPLNDEKREGVFVCAACGLPLFESSKKYDSRTGWPSFFAAIEGRIGTSTDYKLGYPRTEYHCARCGGHQGHIFDDGPRPTGKRFCNNGVALQFVPEGTPLPELRN